MRNLPDLLRSMDEPFGLGEPWHPFLKQFDDFFSEMQRKQPLARESGFQVQCDLEELENHYKLSFDMPGVDKDSIKVELRDNRLSVEGERKFERSQNEGRSIHTERSWGKFKRVISLPEGIKPEGVEAIYKNGVLSVAVEKPVVSKAHTIPINEGRTGFLKSLLGGKESSKDSEPISVKREQTV